MVSVGTLRRDCGNEIIFKMKLTSKDEFEILSKRVENLEKKINQFQAKKIKKIKQVKKS